MDARPTHDTRPLSSESLDTMLLQGIFHSLPDLIFVKDAQGVFIACNSRFAAFNGTDVSGILGKTDYDFLPKSVADEFARNDALLMNEGKDVAQREWLTSADGKRILLDTIKTVIRFRDGTVGGILGVCRDITEQFLAGERLQQNAVELRTYIENAPYGIAMLDDEGRYVDLNPAVRRVLERPPGMEDECIFAYKQPPDVKQVLDDILQKIVRTGILPPTEVRIFSDEVHEKYVEMTAIRLDENQNLLFLNDVTARRHAECSFRRQERLLQEQLWEVLAGIDEIKQSKGERFTIKQLERTRKRLETRLEKIREGKGRDDVVTFEQLGVDRLFVDEAHNYKNRAKRCATNCA